MHFKYILPAVLLVCILCGILDAAVRLPRCTLTIENSAGEKLSINTEIAATNQSRAQGLMFRKSLAQNEGMLFVFEIDQNLSFWMKNVTIPLAIAYIDSSFVIKDIIKMAPLDSTITYPSSGKVRYALEMNQDFFESHSIKPGDTVDLSLCLKKPR